jgi:hypothetical protein
MVAEPPRNGEYLVAAYLVATVILLGYWLRLWRKGRSVSGASQRRKREA